MTKKGHFGHPKMTTFEPATVSVVGSSGGVVQKGVSKYHFFWVGLLKMWGFPRFSGKKSSKITKSPKMAKIAIFGLSGKVPKMAFFLVQEAEMSLCITPCEGVSRGVQKWDPFLVTFGGLK